MSTSDLRRTLLLDGLIEETAATPGIVAGRRRTIELATSWPSPAGCSGPASSGYLQLLLMLLSALVRGQIIALDDPQLTGRTLSSSA